MTHNLSGSSERGRERLRELAAAINAKYGTHTALPLDVASVAEVMRLPFGIFDLDWKTRGGLPIGRLSRLWGPKSSLKTTTCLRVVAQGQRYCRHCKFPIVEDPKTGKRDCRCPNPRYTLANPDHFSLLSHEQGIQIAYGMLPKGATRKEPFLNVTYSIADKKDKRKSKQMETRVAFAETYRCEPWRCVYIDSEHTIDKKWALKNGVDTKLVALVGGKWAEQVLDVTEELLLTQDYDLVIIDSVSMLATEDEITKSMRENPMVARQANLVTRAMKKWLSAMAEGGLMNRYAPTIVCTSQVRTKGIGYGQHAYLAPTGGHAEEHVYSLDIRMKAEGYEFDGDVAKFGTFGFRVDKNKCGGFPEAEGSFRFWLRPTANIPVGDTEDMNTVVEHGRKLGILATQKGKLILPSTFLDHSGAFKTQKELHTFLRENQTVYADLRSRVLDGLMHVEESAWGESVQEEPPKEDEGKGLKKPSKEAKAPARVADHAPRFRNPLSGFKRKIST